MKDFNPLKYARMRDFHGLKYTKLLTYLQIPKCPLTVKARETIDEALVHLPSKCEVKPIFVIPKDGIHNNSITYDDDTDSP